MPIQSKSQSGYSIIELSIVLAIISLLIVTGVTGVTRVLQNNQANNLLRDITTITGNVTIALGRATTTSDVDSDLMAQLNVFPDGVANCPGAGFTNCTLTNPFGGPLVVNNLVSGATTLGAIVNRAYWVAFGNVPSSMCASVARGLESLASVIVVDNDVPPFDVVTQYTTNQSSVASSSVVKAIGQDIDISDLASQCQGTADKAFGVLVRR